MRIIVTGGCGFIGSHVVENLTSAGHEVLVLDNLSTGRLANLAHLSPAKISGALKFIECDLSIKGDWCDLFKGMDWVVHTAALADIVPSIKNPDAYYRTNVTGTFNVLEACRAANIKKLVYTASSSCYGIPKEYPTSENAPISPEYPYALTKYLGEQLVLHWSKVYGLNALSLRFFNVYGPRSRTSGTYGAVFGVFLAQKLAKKPFTVVGDGKQTRDFTFVTDIASAIVAGLERGESGQIYNVGSGATVSVMRLTELLGGDIVFIPKRPGEPDCTFADIARIGSHLGWAPSVCIEEGVKRILENIEYWREAPVWDPRSIAIETKEWFNRLR